MEFALFLGCTTPSRLKAYEASSRAVLGELGVTLVDIDEFKCCGYPLRNIDFKAFVLSSARNLALAKKEDLKLMALCKCGYGTLKMASHLIKENSSLREEINEILAKEGLEYKGDVDILHFLTVLHKEVGLEAIKDKITRPYENLKVATHYGCHALRPSQVTEFDDPVAPTLFDELVSITGAKSIEWPMQLECCGGPLLGINDELSLVFRDKKLLDAKKAGAAYLTTACPFCQIQFETAQNQVAPKRGTNHRVPSILYPQLLGLCLGLDKETLGLYGNHGGVAEIENFLAP
ncbi:MAG: CoB--CoM heterodisulfide reductase iron-sulfur subunit B family protein [Desulfobacterales bacterium]|nr:CoB--CoM heterodisulfide reductase iron-sulfur subunit B family protein [Desulfobacterales bacterium]